MQTLWLDILHALRLMRQSRGPTAVAVLSLALAIGVNASVFSLLNAVVLRPLTAPRPDQFVAVETIRPNSPEGPLAFPAFERLASRQSVFSSVVGYWGVALLLAIFVIGGYIPGRRASTVDPIDALRT